MTDAPLEQLIRDWYRQDVCDMEDSPRTACPPLTLLWRRAVEGLHEATQRLEDQFAPTRIILFGSHARGTADERSDVDLLVVCPVAGRKRDLMVAMDRALAGLGIARDVIVLTPEEYERDRHIPGTVARPASLEGKVLYDSPA